MLRRWMLPTKIKHVKDKKTLLDKCSVGRKQDGGHAILIRLSLLQPDTPPSETGKHAIHHIIYFLCSKFYWF